MTFVRPMPMKSSPSTALARVELKLEVYAEDPSWQRVWLTLEPESWRSLAFIPTGNISALDLVHGLASVAWQQRGNPVIVADLRTITLAALPAVRTETRNRIDSGNRILMAVRSLDESPISATLARDADKAVLCVYPGQTMAAHVRHAIKELGLQRYLGAILIQRSEK
jgi:hypothetical protein